ncbi:MAG: PqqD family protein [Anaerolineae bacterium]|nr:PqqD family protein [Anaerolineae bacterium]
MTVSLIDVIAPAPGVVSRVIEGEAVIVLPEQGRVKVLNEVGSRIWALADECRTLESIVETICQEYEVTPAQAEADALAFVEELVQGGALTVLRA